MRAPKRRHMGLFIAPSRHVGNKRHGHSRAPEDKGDLAKHAMPIPHSIRRWRQNILAQDLRNGHLAALEKAAQSADHRTFDLLVRAIDWSVLRPADLARTLDLALALDMVSLARELAQQGSKVFPEDKRLQQALAVLLPPAVIRMRPAQGSYLEASQKWLKEHASQYKGQWVAVRSGTLLGSAPTLQELYQQIGPHGKTALTVIVKVVS